MKKETKNNTNKRERTTPTICRPLENRYFLFNKLKTYPCKSDAFTTFFLFFIY